MTKSEQILDAATKLFIEYGFHATPTSKIAKEADVSNGTLFHYFNTKEELISELYLSIKRDLKVFLIEGFNEQKTTKQKIKYVWLNWVRWGISNKYRFMFLEQFYNSPYIKSVSKDEASKSFKFMMDMLKEGIEEETLIDIDPELMLMLMYASVNSVVRYSCTSSKISDDHDLEVVFKMFWKSIVNI